MCNSTSIQVADLPFKSSGNDSSVLDKAEGFKDNINPEPQTSGTAGKAIPAATTAPKPSIIYHVKFKNASGEVTEVRKPTEPFQLKPTVEDLPVLEVHTTVTPIDSQKPGNTSEDVKVAHKLTKAVEAGIIIADNPDTHPENFRVSETTLRIRSSKLLNVLRAVVKYYPGQTLLGDTVSFSEPFQLLVHHRAELEEYKSRNPEMHSEDYKRTCNEHTDVLLEFLRNHFGKSLIDEEERHRRTPPVCTFEYTWLLLKPGEPCYALGERYKYLPCNIKTVKGGMVQGRPTSYEVPNWNVQCDGYELGRVSTRCFILPFDGEKEIKFLTIFPKRFFKDSPKDLEGQGGLTLEQKFVAKGRKYWDLAKSYSYKRYEGATVKEPYQHIDGRIIVDFSTYYAQNTSSRPYLSGAWVFDELEDENETATGTSGCECEKCSTRPDKARQNLYQDYDCVDPKTEPPNRDNFFFLCDGIVPAFVLNDRKWALLDAEFVKDIDVQPDTFKYLVLQPGIKHDIEALCRTHMRSKKARSSISADFIRGKGEGLIFLLHGPPGVGKTCTAESIAELLERPLLALTCSDLGTTAESVAKNLDSYLTLGELWDAVVLLDEADIYFEERSLSDVKRNSVVTVFLRALEYYRGLLFLTTNRVNTFDEAFKSRIHVPLHYRRLSRDQQSAIWNNCFERAEKNSIVITKASSRFVSEDPALLEREWNGREIQNAFQTALALARYDAEDEGTGSIKVKSVHLKRVVRLSALFSDYLGSMRGEKRDGETALRNGLRNDNFGQSEQPKISKKAQVAAAAAAKKKNIAVKKRAKETEDEDESDNDDDPGDQEKVEESETNEEEADEKHRKTKKTTTTKITKTVMRGTEKEEESDDE